MDFSNPEKILAVLLIIMALAVGVSFSLYFITQSKVNSDNQNTNLLSKISETIDKVNYTPPQKLKNSPEIIKAVYVTGHSVASKKYLDYLDKLFKNTEINAVVVDVKDSTGNVTYNSGAKEVKKYGLSDGLIYDIDDLVNFFHDRNIYLIGRVAVFEDPKYSQARPDLAIYYDNSEIGDSLLETVTPSNDSKVIGPEKPILWTDNNGLTWLDPASKDVWDYNISVAKDALYHGFDEINFDYIRFPSDGNLQTMGFPFWDGVTPLQDIIKSFFQYLRINLAGEKISADLFGQTTTERDDMGIGQFLENSFENFDYICPMLYPSHYADGFLGFGNPADHPYEIVKYSLDYALARENIFEEKKQKDNYTLSPLAKIRPWLQDFNMKADYNAFMVQQEIQASKDALKDKFDGFMLWSPYNIYTQGAVLKY